MKYHIELSHDDFVLLMSTLKKAQDDGVINWSATAYICERTKVEFEQN